MLGRFGRDVGSLLGVDIASGCLRMLHVRRHAGRYQVSGWACEALAPAVAGLLPAADTAQVVQALGRAHRRCASRQRQVALALPASQVICKVCQVPRAASAEAIEAQLLAEAEQLFPFPLDDLALDFQRMQPSPGAPGLVDVLVAACRQSQLDPLEQLFAEAGLELVAMEVDSFALRRALGPAPSPRVALLQLEADEAVLHCWPPDHLPRRQQLPLAAPEQWHEAVSSLLHLCAGQVDELALAGGAVQAATAVQLSERLRIPCRLVELPGPARLGDPPGAAMTLAYGLALGGLQ